MPRIEIDETEYADLKRVAEAARAIGAHPKGRELMQEAVALVMPDQAGPEIRIRHEVTEKLTGIEKTIADFIAAQAKDKEDRVAEETKRQFEGEWTRGRQKLRDAGYNDEGVGKVEELMVKRNIADHEAAMALFERENPPQEAVSTGSAHWNFFDRATTEAPDFKALLGGDDEGFLATAIPSALNQARGR